MSQTATHQSLPVFSSPYATAQIVRCGRFARILGQNAGEFPSQYLVEHPVGGQFWYGVAELDRLTF